MRFLDVTTDYAFKRVFGSASSKPALISFLNSVLEYDGGHAIADLDIVDPYQVPQIVGMKDTYVDVKAVLKNGKRVIIEMQVLNVHGFEGRILHNAAKEYSQQLKKGDDYELLRPVVALTLTDFVMFPEAETHISRFKLLETERLTKYSDDLELVFVELPKFTKSELELVTGADRWLYFVKHAGSLQVVPEALRGDPALQAAFDMALESALSLEELEVQHRQFDFIRLQRGSIAKGFADGRAKGLAEGLAEGEAIGRQRERAEMRAALIAKLVVGGMGEAEAAALVDR